MKKDFQGCVQVYTGDGKGKTTAALGLIVRALGAGFRVALVQFLKKGDYSEIRTLRRFEPQLSIYQFHSGGFVRGHPDATVCRAVAEGWRWAREIIKSGEFQLVVLDEINVALSLKLLSPEEVVSVLRERPSGVEVVLTGRNAPEEVIEFADLVTEMRKLKHYYERGIPARLGIEK
ncbi:cob(I)yrinic acid a,c-diamide adenosyltransferase [Thermosulfurimonas sp. F29]|uniref:cob(I)yrinic acid a,c-diamide adenosyltransferase n=1 Tax=Thermosulfurimonas sp. F29 TaxID=2867247 RepID=UPI001C832F10|nr:cob(I)yrinic acid a,c-diamide adenosyltransferase [Thermosulfurimonas sp. F29]MBX6423893.1 cob(I)yrinic acid a,c-diamide adenosyltransferase [Thermosulfurimonas sp. F29]